MEVLDYGERATKNGFVLISGPGNDLAGVTGQIAGRRGAGYFYDRTRYSVRFRRTYLPVIL